MHQDLGHLSRRTSVLGSGMAACGLVAALGPRCANGTPPHMVVVVVAIIFVISRAWMLLGTLCQA